MIRHFPNVLDKIWTSRKWVFELIHHLGALFLKNLRIPREGIRLLILGVELVDLRSRIEIQIVVFASHQIFVSFKLCICSRQITDVGFLEGSRRIRHIPSPIVVIRRLQIALLWTSYPSNILAH